MSEGSSDRIEIVRHSYRAFADGDRELAERVMGPGLRFHAPPDPELDRDGYFERCWPGAGSGTEFEFVRLFEHGEEVVATYEATRADRSRFRNTEIHTVRDGRIVEIEVYFGWNL